MSIKNHKNIATFMHLGAFSKYFIPFGNYIVPILLWTTNKDKSDFIDDHGKEAINFQLSILLYTVILGIFSFPFFIFHVFGDATITDLFHFNDFSINFSDAGGFRTLMGASFIGIIALIGFFLEIIFVITAALKANKGESYRYPLSIRFIK
ncbi:putative Tic20 family protein [Aquimarina sp. EL_43]|uniref:DUF4870 domain-containing protein n=1 Tax=Aquimarina TaxID=290174 RepID=UPI00047169AF|nr:MULTISPECIES: DUF4870 domain-containing protein [Aquimarina]MBG6129089.1 putative Tic20 family protein [Aquimarina sp. EL_35]MBG6150154.1 putative Tic20 family protein [Aquimarina sp. EL_32]MBG6167161.1 putative Tic20 family protein [Aquimarina sp. EL_43]